MRGLLVASVVLVGCGAAPTPAEVVGQYLGKWTASSTGCGPDLAKQVEGATGLVQASNETTLTLTIRGVDSRGVKVGATYSGVALAGDELQGEWHYPKPTSGSWRADVTLSGHADGQAFFIEVRERWQLGTCEQKQVVQFDGTRAPTP